MKQTPQPPRGTRPSAPRASAAKAKAGKSATRVAVAPARSPKKPAAKAGTAKVARARAKAKSKDQLPLPFDDSETYVSPISLASVRAGGMRLLRTAGEISRQAVPMAMSTVRVATTFVPLTQMLGSEKHITAEELNQQIDSIFEALHKHPITEQTRRLTMYLRARNMLPNEGSTESLIRYVINESVARSPIPVPQQIIDEFWTFFHELMDDPEIGGLAELSLDITRLLLKTYEPLLVEVINELKDIFFSNQTRLDSLLSRVQIVRRDLTIIKRQIRALRYIKPFFQTDPKDFHAQAQIVAKMVREFGPFFIKMAQVAATTADFLPEEIAQELTVFQEDVPPMSAEEARIVIRESFGRAPEEIYFGFDAERPLKSGSIGSVYLAKKPVVINGIEHLLPVIIKVGRHNIDREFLMGKTSIGLMLLSSQYWAPHSKLSPFLKAMTEQIDVFVEGFRSELQFEREAKVQSTFALRAVKSGVWKVPQVYAASDRVIEMEYIRGAVNISRAIETFKPRNPRQYRRDLARKFLFTVLTHIFVYQEVHGDLHPGNVMVDPQGKLHLVDWGNSIKLAGRMAPLMAYIKGALVADPDMLTDALIDICTNPTEALMRRDEIREALVATLQKKNIRPLGYDFALTLYMEGPEAWTQRVNTLAHLMSNTQQLGLVVRGEYLHISRSLSAMVGTLGQLYSEVPRYQALYDILVTINTFPANLLQDFMYAKRVEVRRMMRAVTRRAILAMIPKDILSKA